MQTTSTQERNTMKKTLLTFVAIGSATIAAVLAFASPASAEVVEECHVLNMENFTVEVVPCEGDGPLIDPNEGNEEDLNIEIDLGPNFEFDFDPIDPEEETVEENVELGIEEDVDESTEETQEENVELGIEEDVDESTEETQEDAPVVEEAPEEEALIVEGTVLKEQQDALAEKNVELGIEEDVDESTEETVEENVDAPAETEEIAITDEAPEEEENQDTGDELPKTGVDSLHMLLIALALLVAGSLLLASSKIKAAEKVVA